MAGKPKRWRFGDGGIGGYRKSGGVSGTHRRRERGELDWEIERK